MKLSLVCADGAGGTEAFVIVISCDCAIIKDRSSHESLSTNTTTINYTFTLLFYDLFTLVARCQETVW